MKWELPFPSSVVSTLLVLVVDFLGIWLLDVMFAVTAAFLTARDIYDRHKAVNVSDMWFEHVIGRTHGPIWLRKTQFAVKAVVLVCSILVGLSINGKTEPRKVTLPGQTVVVSKTRRLAQLGVGTGRVNFSKELLFVREAFNCRFSFSGHLKFQNCMALKDINGQFGGTVPVKCLRQKGGYQEETILQTDPRKLYARECIKLLPSKSEIQSGNGTVHVENCAWRRSHWKCEAERFGGCVFVMEKGDNQILVVGAYHGNEFNTIVHSSTYTSWRKRDEETVMIMAKYVDHGLSSSPLLLDYLTSFQGVAGSVEELKGTQFSTDVHVELFWCGMGPIIGIIGASTIASFIAAYCTGVKQRSDYALATKVAEVARLARSDEGGDRKDFQRDLLFVKLHPRYPHVTVSSDSNESGTWDEDQVLHRT